MTAPLVEVKNLKKHFVLSPSQQRVHAVDGVDLTIIAGEIVGLVGESGCGKSTLGRCIVRLIDPTFGSVQYRGVDVATVSGPDLKRLRQSMQIVFQDPFASLDPRWRIYEILEEPLRVHNIVPPPDRKTEIVRLLQDVGLSEDALNRFPHEFSGGQRQRIGIARAIASKPDFLIADEPVSALDVSVRSQILNLLLKLRRERGISILFIGHDLGVVRQISSRIAVMYLGVIVESAPSDQLFDSPSHPYTRTLLSAIPSIKNVGLKESSGMIGSADVPSPVDLPSGCRFRMRCEFARELCSREVPPLMEVVPGEPHRSACHFRAVLPPFARPCHTPAPKTGSEAPA